MPYAENQSMFLDSLVDDSDWRAIYARDADNKPIPFEVLEEEMRSSHPFAVLKLRGMLSVSYFEKALYELPPENVTADKIKELADQTEIEILGGYAERPILAVSACGCDIWIVSIHEMLMCCCFSLSLAAVSAHY